MHSLCICLCISLLKMRSLYINAKKRCCITSRVMSKSLSKYFLGQLSAMFTGRMFQPLKFAPFSTVMWTYKAEKLSGLLSLGFYSLDVVEGFFKTSA